MVEYDHLKKFIGGLLSFTNVHRIDIPINTLFSQNNSGDRSISLTIKDVIRFRDDIHKKKFGQ